jgi:hypothetical protein
LAKKLLTLILERMDLIWNLFYSAGRMDAELIQEGMITRIV